MQTKSYVEAISLIRALHLGSYEIINGHSVSRNSTAFCIDGTPVGSAYRAADRVTFPAVMMTARTCPACKKRHFNACPTLWGGVVEYRIGPLRKDGRF